mgnify:CR=1 FL=1
MPFCSFNVLPDIYRDRVQKVYGISLKKWLELKGMEKPIIAYKYKRNIRKLISGEIYRKGYEGIINVDSIPYEEHVKASQKFGIPVVE